jgi:spore germination cell wall hydrolase CwlJ-like protein
MVGATALGSVMGLTFSGAYLAGGMANAAVVNAPNSDPEVTRRASSDPFASHTTPRVEIGSYLKTSRHDGDSVFGSAERATFTSLTGSVVSNTDAASKLGAFQQTYAAPAAQAFPVQESASEYTVRRSARELDCLTAALYYEARGEGQSGMEAVAQVIVNRARHPDFPKTLCGVIYQGAGKGRGCQFSFACDGSMRRRSETALWDRARAVAERAMEGRVSTEVGNSTFFHATRISPNWRGLTRVATVGRHVFYRHAGARGSGERFLRGTVGDIGGTELASVTAPVRSYRIAATAPKPSRAVRSVRASYTPEPEQPAPYKIARSSDDTVVAPDAQPTETISLDTIVDAAATSS